MKSLFAAAAALTVTACASHAAPPASVARASKPDEATALFRFHADFWANLNEVLLHEALLPRPRWEGPKSLKNHHVVASDTLAPAEAAEWREALAYYDAHFTTNNLFDRFIDAMPALLAVDASRPPRRRLRSTTGGGAA